MAGPTPETARALVDLRQLLAVLQSGPVTDYGAIAALLSTCWDGLKGGDATSFQGYKLIGRMEGVNWTPPHLTFRIERHGGTVRGSSRADLQEWIVDVDSATARCEVVGRRQLRPMARRLDVTALAQATTEKIRSGSPDEGLQWQADGSVRVLVGQITPTGPAKQTTAGRRKRFWVALDSSLHEWTREGSNRYRRN